MELHHFSVALHHTLYLIRKYFNHIRYQLWCNATQWYHILFHQGSHQ